MQISVLVVAAFLGVSVTATPIHKKAIKLGCQNCHPVDSEKINVHLIPHSHDDVGWLKTLDQYYYGSHNDIQNAGVQYIISSSVESLKANPDRRFIQVETAFFWKWWQHQNEDIQKDVINLVNNGQLEIINAAWSMNDEAAVHYQSTIDQFTLGLATINDTLGKCGAPRIGWQIDPFGHSREQASIFAQLGYEGVFFARIDFEDKNQRIKDQNMEVVWQGSASLDNTKIFTNMFPEFYYPPGGFCFDVDCGDEMLVDDKNSPDYNIPRKVDDFAKRMLELAKYYRTKNVLIPMGGDFQYQEAERNFINMDRLITAFKDHDEINLIYSTPTCYVKAVNDEAEVNDVAFTLKTDDFFPYGSDGHQYWTGYFTSRPNAKRFERVANNVLQGAKQIGAVAKGFGAPISQYLNPLREAVGILQHHDAITGTAKAAVAKDYSRILSKGINTVQAFIGQFLDTILLQPGQKTLNLNLKSCLLGNVSICGETNSDSFVVVVQNCLERPDTSFVRIPVPDAGYKVTGVDGEIVVDVIDAIADFKYITDLNDKPQPKELVFTSTVLGLGFQVYYVEKTDKKMVYEPVADTKFGTDQTGFEIDAKTGLLSTVTINGKSLPISQQFLYYKGHNGDNNGDDNAASGAYLFRPIDNTATPVADNVTVTAIKGNLVDEVRQQVNSWITQIIRVYKNEANNYIEFDWLIGPIEVDEDQGIGKEIVTRFTVSDFDSENSFYTDSNGREMIKRVLNKRYDYTYDSTREPVASNYYPVTAKISIKDEKQNLQVSVLNDRAQGGTSLANGQIELMLHRRLLRDDAKGVGEALNDSEFGQSIAARGQLQLIFGESNGNANAEERILALQKLLQPLVWIGGNDMDLKSLTDTYVWGGAGMARVLPENVHILTMEPWKDDTFILRFEHIFEKGEDVTLSEPVEFDLVGLFPLFNVHEVRETTLGANQWLDEFEKEDRLEWNLVNGEKSKHVRQNHVVDDSLIIKLNPMEIRTFVVK